MLYMPLLTKFEDEMNSSLPLHSKHSFILNLQKVTAGVEAVQKDFVLVDLESFELVIAVLLPCSGRRHSPFSSTFFLKKD